MSPLPILDKLTDDEFAFFKAIVYREAGIKLSDMKVALLQSRIMRRMRALQISTFRDYRNYLNDYYQDEIVDFINAVTTNKTEFLRENKHFDFMLSTALPNFEKSNREEIRIWSAGCSTGEEPYSIAVTCCEYFNKNKIPVKILATDIDTQVLIQGYTGIYPKNTIDVFTPTIQQRYFNAINTEKGVQYQIVPEVKKMITFKRLNLLDNTYPMRKKFDIIFCRNVIIYFDKDTQRVLFEKMYNYIADDGFLFIGHSENLSGVNSNFKSVGHTIYRK
ncbi:MAG TPA: protein-glutamate O-methyltransferase CheR [Spirochaetota bacterium]|nr:protein-glutamate O-methyltransferase CheR [Spirochaetota bacterium]